MKKKFSIIVPVYNVSAYLDKCIKSVVSQTYEEFELILIDDGSEDGSEKICDDWMLKDSRIWSYHQQNAGAAAARNAGVKFAQGEYIIFLDADDWWKNRYVLEKINNRISKETIDVLCFNFQKSYGGKLSAPYFRKEDLKLKKEGYCINDILEEDLWISSPCNKVICSKLFTKDMLLFRTGISAEDIDWCLRLALIGERFDYIEEIVFVYRQREKSESHHMDEEKIQCLWNNVKRCISILEENTKSNKESLKKYVSYQYGVFLYSLALLSPSKSKKILIKEAKTQVKWLAFSSNKKIKILRLTHSILGFYMMLKLLKIKCVVENCIRRKR